MQYSINPLYAPPPDHPPFEPPTDHPVEKDEEQVPNEELREPPPADSSDLGAGIQSALSLSEGFH